MKTFATKVHSIVLGLAAAALSIGHSESVQAQSADVLTCSGSIFNPVTDPDWNNIYPITIAGARATGGGRTNPPLMDMNAVCVCPSGLLGLPMIGIGVTYWQPTYLVEIEHRPFCLPSIGGVSVGGAAASLGRALKSTENVDEGSETSQTNLSHIHWYEYPVFAMLNWIQSFMCNTPTGFNLLYMTEIDPTWDDDAFASYLAPESALFANPIAQGACVADAVASNTGYPLDPLFWCAGSWGSTYPLSGNTAFTNSIVQKNNAAMARFMAKQARMGLSWQTIGPTAQCASHINPIWVKSQYRVNQVGPVARRGAVQTIGDMGLTLMPPVANYPGRGEHTVNLIWQGKQCCLKAIP